MQHTTISSLFKFCSMVILAAAMLTPTAAFAAEFHSGESLSFSSTDTLRDAYIAGSTVTISAPVANDLAVAGGTVTLNSDIEKDLLASGGTITVNSKIGETARIAGGTVTINGPIGNDLIVMGGTIDLTEKATVGGDLVITGGTITINGNVTGKVIINGGTATINSQIGSLANTHLSQSLTLGSKAVVNGNFSYEAPREASIDQAAQVKGQTDFKRGSGDNDGWLTTANWSTTGFFYGILSSLIFGFVLLYLLHKMTRQSVEILRTQPWQSAAWGLGVMFLFPIVAAIATVLSVWLGISSFILYALVLVVGFALAQILLGWWLLQWWLGRTKEKYALDWRAVIIGVLAATILMLVPVLGWLIMSIMFILALGTLGQQIWNLRLRP
jgi:hypothetical protein